MQVMLAAFIQMNTKYTGIQSVQADQIGRTYPPLFTLDLPKDARLLDQIYVIQPPMFPPRYDDTPPQEYEYSQ